MLILIAGPYRSGTQDDPALMQANLLRLEAAALEVFRLGHLPMIGEWAALPLMRAAGSKLPGDAVWESIQNPVAHSLLEKCDAVYRIQGLSNGPDPHLRTPHHPALPFYYPLS